METTFYCEFDHRKLVFPVQLPIPCEISDIEPVIHRMIETIRETNCLPESHFEVDLAFREALANAVVHGCRGDSLKAIQLGVACDESRGVLIVVRAPARGFNTNSIPLPVLGQRIHSSHGRGIFLINQIMDEVPLEYGGDEIRMPKKQISG